LPSEKINEKLGREWAAVVQVKVNDNWANRVSGGNKEMGLGELWLDGHFSETVNNYDINKFKLYFLLDLLFYIS